MVLWAGIFFISTFLDILVYPEFILILDCLSIVVCVLAPIVILLVHDLNGLPPDDNILLLLGFGGIGFSVISLVIIGVVLRASYTFWRLVPELLLRAGQMLFGIATLQKALRIRRSYPLATPVEPEKKRVVKKAQPPSRQEAGFALHLEEGVRYTSRTPRPAEYADRQYPGSAPRSDAIAGGYPTGGHTGRVPDPEAQAGERYGTRQETARTPRPDTLQSGRPERDLQNTARTPRLEREPDAWQTGRIIIQGGTGRIPTRDPGTVPAQRQTCPYCGKRMPLGFPNCPRCGRDM